MTQQTAKVNIVANLHSYNRNNADCSCLLIDHTDSCLVSNHTRNGCCRSIARNCNHIKTYRANTGHSFQFLDSQSTSLYSINHTLVFTYRNESTTQTTYV